MDTTWKDKLWAAMNDVEYYVESCFPILGSYYLVKKSGLYNKFQLLYNSLPQELIDNKNNLNENNEENIFSFLNEISYNLEQSKTFLGFMTVNVNTIKNSLDMMIELLKRDLAICHGESPELPSDEDDGWAALNPIV